MNGPHAEEPRHISERLAQYYYEIILMHQNDRAIGACLICRRVNCPDWRFAVERLICAGYAVV